MTGLGTLAIREIADRGLTRDLLRRLGAMAVVVSAGAGVVTAFATPALSADLRAFATAPAGAVAVVLAVVLSGLGQLADHLALARLQAHYQLIRNSAFAVAKIVLLFVFLAAVAPAGPMAVVLSWLFGIVASFAVVVVLGQFRALSTSVAPATAASFMRIAPHYALNAAIQLPHIVLPVLAVALISSAAAGYFYISWMIASFQFVIPASLTLALFAVTAGKRSPQTQLRFSLAVATVAGLGSYLVLFAIGPVVLAVLGAAYRANGSTAMLVFGLGVFPLVVRDHFVAIVRVHDALWSGLPLLVIGGTIELGLSAVGAATDGLNGLAVGWLIAVVAQAMLLGPAVFRELRTSAT